MARLPTASELRTIRWLLDRSALSDSQRVGLVTDLGRLEVENFGDRDSSIYFYLEGKRVEQGRGITMHADLIAPDNSYGIFVYSDSGHLAGVDVYGLANSEACPILPTPEELAGWISVSTDGPVSGRRTNKT